MFRTYGRLVWRTVRQLGVPDAQLEDAVQDVFLVVHRRAGSFRGDASPKTWVLGIALRVAADYRRSLKRRFRIFRREGLSDLDTVSAPRSSDPQAQTEQAQLADQLMAFLNTLGEKNRAVFTLVDLNECSVREAADALGLRVSTASSRLQVARRAVNTWAEQIHIPPSPRQMTATVHTTPATPKLAIPKEKAP